MSTDRKSRAPRTVLKAHILIHKLSAIATLAFLPLLAWHMATLHLVDNFHLPFGWQENLRHILMTAFNESIWVLIWILVSLEYDLVGSDI